MKTKSVCQETIVKEYDEELTSCQEVVESEGLAGTKANKYQIIGDLLYYVSSEDESPRMRLYVPKDLQSQVLEKCHEKMQHISINKIFQLINRKYHWPGLYSGDGRCD